MKTKYFPREGSASASVMEEMDQFRTRAVDWKGGKVWSLVYYLDEDHQNLVREAYDSFFHENYLNSFAFPGLQDMERDVVRMVAEMVNGHDVVGAMSSGGTESIMLAVLAYREQARAKGENKKKEILVPATVHPAFEKAAHMFGLDLVRIPVKGDKKVDLEALKKQISPRTLLLVASAPGYPFGVVDPIREVSELALRHKLPMHVDACIGGFVLPWAEQLGYWKGEWDFRLPGVTSMSLDVHKFGFAAKGASVVMYRDMELMKRQFFVSTQFPGGIYVSPTLLGSRPGGAIAAAWASIKRLGWDGYLESTKRLMEGSEWLREFFRSTPGLELVGDSKLNIIAYRTVDNRPDIFIVADFLEKKGWLVDRQQFPQCIHLTVLPTNLPVLEAYTADVLEALEYVKLNPKVQASGSAAMYGVIAKMPLRSVIGKEASQVFENLYSAEGSTSGGFSTPSWMGPLNRVLGWLRRK